MFSRIRPSIGIGQPLQKPLYASICLSTPKVEEGEKVILKKKINWEFEPQLPYRVNGSIARVMTTTISKRALILAK